MFPDPTIEWVPYPSIIDGIAAPPFALDIGLWRGVLNLIVVESKPGTRAYGIQIDCRVYAAFGELIHSLAPHRDFEALRYHGGVYIKEAPSSQLLAAYTSIMETSYAPQFKEKLRHFAFVGTDFCYETLGRGEPAIRAFASPEEAYAWRVSGGPGLRRDGR
jgi:hypothetical protein